MVTSSTYWQFRVVFPTGGFSIAGAYAPSEVKAMLDVADRFRSATEILPYIPGEPAVKDLGGGGEGILCGTFEHEYRGSKWPYCGKCGQIYTDHPVQKGTRAGEDAEKFLANPYALRDSLPMD
jgi:hypothetical protein